MSKLSLLNECLLLNLKEDMVSQSMLPVKIRKLKSKIEKSSQRIMFKACEGKDGKIDIQVFELTKYDKKKLIGTINNAFKMCDIRNNNNTIESSMELAERFLPQFLETGLTREMDTKKFYFSFHDERRALNLGSKRWERFI